MKLRFSRDISGVEDALEITAVFGYKDDPGGETIASVSERICLLLPCCVIILSAMPLCVLQIPSI